MNQETGRRERSNFNKTRGISGMFMGALYCVLALFFAFYKREASFKFIGNDVLAIVLLCLMFAYGVFRIYRGYRLMKGRY